MAQQLPGRWTSLPDQALSFLVGRALGTMTRVATQAPVVALTFDDGPHPEWTPRLLALLEQYGARGTFFMVGQSAQRNPEVVRKVAQAGHALGNHSWDHPSFPLISSRERRRQIRACAEVLKPDGRKLFRPPYLHQTLASRLDAVWLGYEVIACDVVAMDWLDHDAETMAERVAGKLRPGSIVLFHDALHDSLEARYADRGPMLAAVRLILEQFSGQYRFVTVPALMNHGQPQRRDWQLKAEPAWLNTLRGIEGSARVYGERGRSRPAPADPEGRR